MREWAGVKKEADRDGNSVAEGQVFLICVVKRSGSEKLKKYKGSKSVIENYMRRSIEE